VAVTASPAARAGAAPAPPGVEGDVERHGYGGQGTVAAQEQHGGENLRVTTLKYAAEAY